MTWRLALLTQLLDGQVLQDAVLDLFEVVVVLVQDLAGLRHVDLAAGQLLPGQAGHPVQVGPDDAVLRRGGRHVGEAAQLALGLAAGLLGQAGLFDPLPKLGRLAVLVLVAQLAADRPKLLAQEVLALGLGHPLAGLGGDLLAQLADGQLVLEQLHEALELGVQHVLFQQLLPDRARQRDRRGDEVRHLARVLQRLDGADQLVRQLLDQRHQPPEHVHQRPAQRLGLDAGGDRLLGHADLGLQVRLGLEILANPDPLQPLDHQPDGAVRAAHQLVDHAGRADLVDVLRAGLLGRVRLLGDERHQPVPAHHVVDQLDRALLATSSGTTASGKITVPPRNGMTGRMSGDGRAGLGLFGCLGGLRGRVGVRELARRSPPSRRPTRPMPSPRSCWCPGSPGLRRGPWPSSRVV